MKIISCYISSFGKIKDKAFDFSDGINVFREENGWGKTTFANFLKDMFFGIPYNARKKEFTEREHFMPWDETSFGGSLVFSEDDKIYRIERTFGKKDKEDTFKLYDETTGLESDDYSENLGEELFQIDRDSFERTVFFPQNALSTGMTSSMNAKLGDLSSARNDINKFDTALQKLSEAKKKYTSAGKTNPGKFTQIKKEIREAREAQDKLPILDEAYNKQKDLLAERRNDLTTLEAEKQDIAAKITRQSLREQKLGEIKAKENAHEKTEKELQELSDFFKHDVPSDDDISDIENKEREAEGLKQKLDQITSTNVSPEKKVQLNKLFPVGELSDEEMQSLRDDEARIRELKAKSSEMALSSDDVKKLKDLRSFFSRHVPTDDEISTMQTLGNALSKYDGKILTLREQYEDAKKKEDEFENTRKREKSGITMLFIILAIISFAAAGTFLVLKYIFFAAGFLAITAVFAILAFIFSKKAKSDYENEKKALKKKSDDAFEAFTEARQEKEGSINDLKAVLSNYLVTPTLDFQDMINEIRDNANLLKVLSEEEKKHIENSSALLDELSNTTIKLNSHLSSFAEVYGLDPTSGDNAHKIISMLSEDRLLYQRVKTEERERKNYSTELSIKERTVSVFIKKYIAEPSEKAIDDISVIREKKINYETAKKRLASEEEDLEQIVLPEDEQVSVKELQEKEAEIDKKISELHHILEQEQQTLDKDSEEYGNVQDTADTLNALLEESAELDKRYSIIDKAETYLTKAKENFLARYMNPIRTALKKYLSFIDEDYDDRNEQINLDMDLKISIVSSGQTHEANYLSGGQSDLSNLAVRFALLDVLFTNEKPVLVLDDPFVNLDERKISSAERLLKNAAADYQIIYFTCHESRALNIG